MGKSRNYWLIKTEPETYSFDQLVKDKQTTWNGVRNFQARNHLKAMKKGDWLLVYHSVTGKEIVGVAVLVREAYPEVDPKREGDWVQVDIKPVMEMMEPVSLETIKKTPALKDLKLIKQGRLSVMPVTAAEFNKILSMGKAS